MNEPGNILNYSDKPPNCRLIVAEGEQGITITEPCQTNLTFVIGIILLTLILGLLPPVIAFVLISPETNIGIRQRISVVILAWLIGCLLARLAWMSANTPQSLALSGERLIFTRHGLFGLRRYEWPISKVKIIVIRDAMRLMLRGNLRLAPPKMLTIDLFVGCTIPELEWIEKKLREPNALPVARTYIP